VRVARIGRTSVTFYVSGQQGTTPSFEGRLTCLVVQKRSMGKVGPDDWILERVRAFAGVPSADQDAARPKVTGAP